MAVVDDRRADEFKRRTEAARCVEIVSIATRLGMTRARERNKWACPSCGSTDNLQLKPGQNFAFCHGGCGRFDTISLVRAQLDCGHLEAVAFIVGDAGALVHLPTSNPVKQAPKVCEASRERGRLALVEAWAALDADYKLWPDEARAWARSRRLSCKMLAALGWRATTGDRWREVIEGLDREAARLGGLVDEHGALMWAWSPVVVVMPYWSGAPMTSELETLRARVLAWDKKERRWGWGKHSLSSAARERVGTWQPQAPYLSRWASDLARAHDLPLVVCEGESDALAALACGAPACGLPGASTWREGWALQLAPPRGLVLLRDADKAGMRLLEALLRDADKASVVVGRSVKPRAHKDVGDAHAAGELEGDLARAGVVMAFELMRAAIMHGTHEPRDVIGAAAPPMQLQPPKAPQAHAPLVTHPPVEQIAPVEVIRAAAPLVDGLDRGGEVYLSAPLAWAADDWRRRYAWALGVPDGVSERVAWLAVKQANLLTLLSDAKPMTRRYCPNWRLPLCPIWGDEVTPWDVASLPREVQGLTLELARTWAEQRKTGYACELVEQGLEAICEALSAGKRGFLASVDAWRDRDMIGRMTA